MYQYILFDLDGTLTDPKIGITKCVQYALAHFGIREDDLTKLEPFIGPPLRESFMEFYGFTKEQSEEAVKKYRERFSDKGLFENELYEGIPQLLEVLKKENRKLAIASSKPTVFVRQILKHFKIEQYFDVIVGSELDGRRDKKVEVVKEALNQLFEGKTTSFSEAAMVGDRKFDMEGARVFGIAGIAVSYGYGSFEELIRENPTHLVNSVVELEQVLH